MAGTGLSRQGSGTTTEVVADRTGVPLGPRGVSQGEYHPQTHRTSRGEETMNKKAQTRLEQLKLALHGVAAPFSCEGTFVPDKPVTIVFKDDTRFEVVRARSSFDQERESRPLLEQCKPAPFGAGKKTRYHRSVRDAFQLKAEGEEF